MKHYQLGPLLQYLLPRPFVQGGSATACSSGPAERSCRIMNLAHYRKTIEPGIWGPEGAVAGHREGKDAVQLRRNKREVFDSFVNRYYFKMLLSKYKAKASTVHRPWSTVPFLARVHTLGLSKKASSAWPLRRSLDISRPLRQRWPYPLSSKSQQSTSFTFAEIGAASVAAAT